MDTPCALMPVLAIIHPDHRHRWPGHEGLAADQAWLPARWAGQATLSIEPDGRRNANDVDCWRERPPQRGNRLGQESTGTIKPIVTDQPDRLAREIDALAATKASSARNVAVRHSPINLEGKK